MLVRMAMPVLCLAMALLWLLPGQFGRSPWKADEGYTFGVVYSMLADGHWLVPTLAGEPFMEKPPLVYWLGAGFADALRGVLPLHEGARMASVACAVAAFGFTWLAAREIDRDDGPPCAPLILAGCPAWLYASRFLVCDVGLLAFQAVAAYGLLRLLRRGDAIGAAWLATGLGAAFMTKGFVSPAANGIGLLLLGADARFRSVLTRRNLAVFVLAAAPWFAAWPAALAWTSPQLLGQWFWVDNVGRFLGLNDLSPSKSWRLLLEAPLLLSPALPVALLAAAQRGRAMLASPARGAWAMVAGWALVLGASAQVRSVYFLPMLVPLALLAGRCRRPAAHPSAADPPVIAGQAAGPATGRAMIALAILGLAALAALDRIPSSMVRRADLRIVLESGAQPGLIAAAVVALAAFLVLRGRLASLRSPAVTWAVCLTVWWAAFVGTFERGLERTTGFAEPYTELARLLPRDGCVASIGLGESERGLLHYYAGLETIRIERAPQTAATCRYLLRQHRGSGPATEGADRWPRLLGSFARPGDTALRFDLLANR